MACGVSVGSDCLVHVGYWLSSCSRFCCGTEWVQDFAGALPDHQVATLLEEQRGWLALSPMADAGYDPWEALETVLSLAPKNLPKDLNSIST